MVESQAEARSSRGIGRAGAVVAGAILLFALLVSSTSARAPVPQFTVLSASVVAPPEPVRASDGRLHIVYEVVLQNMEPLPVELRSVVVRAAGGSAIRSFGAEKIPTILTNVNWQPSSALPAREGGRLWLDLAVRRRREIPRALVLRISVRETSPSGESQTFTFDAARTNVTRRRALPAISPPLHGGPFLNFNGCCGLSPHRIALVPVNGTLALSERYASDFIRIDNQGRGAAGAVTGNESFFTFGEPVYAVADARVVQTLNTVPENVPLTEPPGSAFTERTILGNHVVLRLRDGRYAAYGHLKTGSVRVRRGQRVRVGQVLGQVGNTGQSGGPHLHFQLSAGADPIASNGTPYVFSRFTLAGTVSNIEEFLTGTANADIRRLTPASPRRAQMPLHATVLRFPG